MADSSELGWKVVQEYVVNPLAEDSGDEKRIDRAYAVANRKVKADKKRRGGRFRPYPPPLPHSHRRLRHHRLPLAPGAVVQGSVTTVTSRGIGHSSVWRKRKRLMAKR